VEIAEALARRGVKLAPDMGGGGGAPGGTLVDVLPARLLGEQTARGAARP